MRPSPLPHPPQQIRSRMIHRQLLSPPQPLLHPNPLPHPPQQMRRRMIHKQEFIPLPHPLPHPLSHPHPQFVAVNSLMLNPPDRFILQFYSMPETKSVPVGFKNLADLQHGVIPSRILCRGSADRSCEAGVSLLHLKDRDIWKTGRR